MHWIFKSFEAVLNRSWQPVELIKIESGKTIVNFIHAQNIHSHLLSDIRLRSREATPADCSSFVRPGIDISVLSSFEYNKKSRQSSPISTDARVNSVHRKPHKSDQCSCRFKVNFYNDQDSVGTEIRTLKKEVSVIGIKQISILQRLQRNTCEGSLRENDSSKFNLYMWDSSEDCSSLPQSRLLFGKFLSDLSRFVTASSLKKVSYVIRSVQNKIVYEVMGNDPNISGPMNVLNFKSCDDGKSGPKVNKENQLTDAKGKNAVDVLNHEPYNESPLSCDEEGGYNVSSGHVNNFCTKKFKRRRLCKELMDLITLWEAIQSKEGVQKKTTNSIDDHEEQDHKGGRMLNADACEEVIDAYMDNFDSLPTEEDPTISEERQFEQEKENVSEKGDEVENPDDLADMWEEMETALTSSYLLDGNEGANGDEVLADTNKECKHDYRLDEQIGIYCRTCGFVKTEIRYISEPIVERLKWYEQKKQRSEDTEQVDEDVNNDTFSTDATDLGEPISKENDSVWELIPELKENMHAHQKKAFEFLWKNIAGSMEQSLMEEKSNTSGGCVISHAPGAGKTFLIISFLVSYLKLFPEKRPLVLAPKTTLYTWQKEFEKWNIPMPVYLIHSSQTQRHSMTPKSVVLPGVSNSNGVKHDFDCLQKIKSWNSHPSVLVMGYSSFLALMRTEDKKNSHRKRTAKALRESPGLLILDEGHNPRSTTSKLRKCLMDLPAALRILLSGTLFQNNFGEYFNTLCLARPKFIHEVLEELDSKYRRGKLEEEVPHLLEARARKFFLENIEKKINSNIDAEKMKGIDVLRKITNGFIDVYDGGSSSDTLPGLQIYTLLVNASDEQHEIVQKLQKKMVGSTGYSLEVELLITLGSIHPWLIKTAESCAAKFFSEEELERLEQNKFALRKGSKVRFVLSLISRVMRKEKVLIFCHNLAPVRFLIELFENHFRWKNGKEILQLTGEQDFFERTNVIDKFEDRCGDSKILLASINACAEGISLTAASRVIFLDSEWNPSKTKQAIARAFRPGQEKMVYVYHLLMTGSMEEDKYRRTTWKEWVSCMIFSEELVEDPSKWQAEKIEDDILREMVEEDKSKLIHMIMKNEKTSTS
ncbi:putative DNA helicase chromatin remodeling SNF2 family [Medicago truncatula]|uniref:Putative DNA helicase chromatin remodeling SNF2 family n=1 Tax=Medicago truncatula TaxID=3880 RepID=A0A396JWJ3_MEDTR|nr:putative DNA helicase chromatin remodeling SNF2 family [Medicago truncatula]